MSVAWCQVLERRGRGVERGYADVEVGAENEDDEEDNDVGADHEHEEDEEDGHWPAPSRSANVAPESFMIFCADLRRRIFSQGSSMESTKVASNHMRRRQKNWPSADDGFSVKLWSGFGGGRFG